LNSKLLIFLLRTLLTYRTCVPDIFQVLQDLRQRYLELKCILQTSDKDFWLSIEDEESAFYLGKGEDCGLTNGSEFDESEIQSSAADNDEQYDFISISILFHDWYNSYSII